MIQLENKFFKECMVVMLPTKDKTSIVYQDSTKKLYYGDFEPSIISSTFKESYQHLYILSNEEIKEGDWVYDSFLKKVLQINTSHKKKGEFVMESNADGYKKIIATTNGDLHIEIPCPDGIEGCEVYHAKLLPKPSNDFLKAYCKANGKIDKVLVEYELEFPKFKANLVDGEIVNLDDACRAAIGYKLKIAPDNTITIKPIQLSIEEAANDYVDKIHPRLEEIDPMVCLAIKESFKAAVQWRDNNPSGEKVYSKEEMSKLASDFLDWFVLDENNKVTNLLKSMPVHYHTTQLFDKWIETNL